MPSPSHEDRSRHSDSPTSTIAPKSISKTISSTQDSAYSTLPQATATSPRQHSSFHLVNKALYSEYHRPPFLQTISAWKPARPVSASKKEESEQRISPSEATATPEQPASPSSS